MIFRLSIAAGVALHLCFAARSHAQTTEGRLLLSGGAATDTRGVRSAGWSVRPALVWSGPAAQASLYGRYSRFESQGWAAGGGVAASATVRLGGPFAFRLEGSGDYTRTSYADDLLFLSGAPTLRARLGPVTLSAGAQAGYGRVSFEQDLPGRLLRPPGVTRADLTRHGVGPVLGAEWRALDVPGGALLLAAGAERLEVDSGRYTDVSVRATLARGPLVLSGTLAHRTGPDEDRVWGGARAAWSLTPVVSLLAILESYPANPLTGSLAGRTLGGGVMVSLGAGRTRSTGFPRPAAVPPPGAGLTRVALEAPRARRVEVAGDWNDWRPVPLTRSGNGVWYADLAIPPGTYRYAFRVDGTSWTAPRGPAAVDDGYGGRAAWLTVAPRPAASSTSSKEN